MPHLTFEGGGQEFDLSGPIAAERTLTQVTEENPILMSYTDFVTGRRNEQTRGFELIQAI
jgi:hypothetical protein